MNLKLFVSAILLASGFQLATAQERPKQTRPIAWAYARTGPVEVRSSPSMHKRPSTRLPQGALAKVVQTLVKDNFQWSRVNTINMETFNARTGWVDSSEVESFALDQFPEDAVLFKLLGGPYLDDFTASHSEIIRFLVRQGNQQPALVCLFASSVLPQTRLQVFRRLEGKFAPGASLEFPFLESKLGITEVEVRDPVGDGNECLISHEPFDLGLENRGVNVVIRRIAGNELQKLWEAPLEHRNLASYPPNLRILKPPEENIGAPGTVTTGSVEFRLRERVQEPVWKGKIKFFSLGRDEPLEIVTVEKACGWEGTKFAPLR